MRPLTCCLDPGVSLLVASADAQRRPSCCRAVALASTDDLQTATVFLPMATSQDVLRDIATTRRVAITATNPLDNASVQVKGTSIGVRLAADDEEAFVRSRLDTFASVLDRIGIPRRVTSNVACWPAFAVTVRVEHVFEQTPGPHAGTRVR